MQVCVYSSVIHSYYFALESEAFVSISWLRDFLTLHQVVFALYHPHQGATAVSVDQKLPFYFGDGVWNVHGRHAECVLVFNNMWYAALPLVICFAFYAY